MDYFQYRICCSECQSQTALIAVESNPFMYLCRGCGRVVVVENDAVYTVRKDFFLDLMKRFNTESCGQLIGCTVQANHSLEGQQVRSGPIGTEDVTELKDVLKTSRTVQELLDRL